MKLEENTLNKIVTIIERHCPNVSRAQRSAVNGYANHVLLAYQNRYQLVKKSPDVENLQDLERGLRMALGALDRLSEETIRDLNCNTPGLDADIAVETANRYAKINSDDERYFSDLFARTSATAKSNVLYSRKAALNTLMRGVQAMKKGGGYSIKPNKNQKLDALAVVWACRKVWREEQNPTETGRWDTYPKQPPKFLQDDRVNNPFYSFAKDMFDVFGIEATPSSALSALRRLGGEEALNLSVVNG